MKCTCPKCGLEFEVEVENGPFTPLRAARQKKGLSLNQVSKQTGISIRALGRLERGIGQLPRIGEARKLTILYESTIEDLFPVSAEVDENGEPEDTPTE